MNTKKNYAVPAMTAVEIEAVTLLTGSNTSLGGGGIIPGRPDLTDPDEE